MRSMVWILIAAVVLIACQTGEWRMVPPPDDLEAGQAVYTFTHDEEERGYLLYVPEDYFERYDEPWPLVLFLHGTGERGTNTRQLVTVPPFAAVTTDDAEYPFLLAAPQANFDEDWLTDADIAYDLLQHLKTRLSIDPDRIIVTGFSMGGRGVWSFATDYPDVAAGLVPVSGFWYVEEVLVPPDVCQLADTPIWMFHSEGDSIVPIEGARPIAEALLACGADVDFTVYEDLNHARTAHTAYSDPALIQWMAEQRRD